MTLKAAFIFLAPDVDASKDRSIIKTKAVELYVVGVKNYAEAVDISKKLLEEGIEAIELCGGFGNIGVSKITEAVNNKIPVGVVRFDTHPGLNNLSGDKIFM